MMSRQDERYTMLSTLPASLGHRRLAKFVLCASVLLFVALAPFAKVQLAPMWAFIPIYESWVVFSDFVTAVILYNQFCSFRSHALLLLAIGYLFTGCMAIVHMLTFPGVFAPAGLLGAGPQTTAWLYMFWHGGFPLFAIAYAAFKERESTVPSPGLQTRFFSRRIVACGVFGIMVAIGALTLIATKGQSWLPAIMEGNHYTAAMAVVVGSVWLLTLLAFALLWRRRLKSVLDLWLSVVLCAWLIDIALSSVLNHGRFDVGFYSGRIYGLLATSFVLFVLLVESGMLYARLIELAGMLDHLASTDPLTGIANRRVFEEALDLEWRRSLRNGTPISLLMIDIDHFKLYNDRYGHMKGDQCLRSVAKALADVTYRAGDIVARYGGEEFVIVLPGASLDQARIFGERAAEAVRALAIPHDRSSTAPHVTVSIGISGEPTPLADYATILSIADQALYQAKRAGRNQVAVIAPDAATCSE
jgi:diguanylate cyclase (GGDEF)-like protein